MTATDRQLFSLEIAPLIKIQLNCLFLFQQFTLGIASLSKLGWAGALLEAFLILYLHAASLTGLSAPLRALRVLPRARRTPLARIHALCAVLLAHSTAQPLLVKILGNWLYLCVLLT